MSPEEREIIFRNISKRARELGMEEIARIEKTVSIHRKAKSRDFWLQLLSRSAKVPARRRRIRCFDWGSSSSLIRAVTAR